MSFSLVDLKKLIKKTKTETTNSRVRVIPSNVNLTEKQSSCVKEEQQNKNIVSQEIRNTFGKKNIPQRRKKSFNREVSSCIQEETVGTT